MTKPGNNAERLVIGRLILALRAPEQEGDVLLVALRDSDQKRGNHIARAPVENGLLYRKRSLFLGRKTKNQVEASLIG